jgi:pimeloyl-ACP methyl ester carboxylesterase
MRPVILSRKDDLPIVFDVEFSPQAKAPVILFVHGFKGFKDWGQWPLLSKDLVAKGFHVIRMNFSHNGTSPENPFDFVDLESFGKNTFTQELKDTQHVLDWVFEDHQCGERADLDRIFMLGHSRGGATTMITAAEDARIKKLATLSSVSTLERFSEAELKYWKENGVIHVVNGRTNQNMPLYYSLAEDFLNNTPRLDLEKIIPKIQQPFLVVHAENDETVPITEAHKIHSLAPNSILDIISDADHSFGGGHPYSKDRLPEFTQQAVEKISAFFANSTGQ